MGNVPGRENFADALGPPKFGGLREAVGGCTIVHGKDEEKGTCVTD